MCPSRVSITLPRYKVKSHLSKDDTVSAKKSLRKLEKMEASFDTTEGLISYFMKKLNYDEFMHYCEQIFISAKKKNYLIRNKTFKKGEKNE